MYLLHQIVALTSLHIHNLLLLLLLFIFDVDASEDIAGIVETGPARLAYTDQALLLFVFPDTRGAVLAAGDKGRVQGVQV